MENNNKDKKEVQFGAMQIALLLWQLIGISFIINDPTLSPQLIFLGVIINTTFFFFILCQILQQQTNVLNWAIGTLLLMWYIYYTPIDFTNPGYDPFQRFCYVAIDIASIIYLIGTLSSIGMAKLGIIINFKIIRQLDSIKRFLVG